MAGAIWKYTLEGPSTIITAPIVRFLSVGQQRGAIVIWAVVDESLPERRYELRAYNTGEPLDDEWYRGTIFLGTVQIMASPSIEVVWHVWWREA